jgi:hypothetical protein
MFRNWTNWTFCFTLLYPSHETVMALPDAGPLDAHMWPQSRSHTVGLFIGSFDRANSDCYSVSLPGTYVFWLS